MNMGNNSAGQMDLNWKEQRNSRVEGIKLRSSWSLQDYQPHCPNLPLVLSGHKSFFHPSLPAHCSKAPSTGKAQTQKGTAVTALQALTSHHHLFQTHLPPHSNKDSIWMHLAYPKSTFCPVTDGFKAFIQALIIHYS